MTNESQDQFEINKHYASIIRGNWKDVTACQTTALGAMFYFAETNAPSRWMSSAQLKALAEHYEKAGEE